MPVWLQAILFALCTFSVFFLPIFLIENVDRMITAYRRTKYPEYFKYYDEGMTLTIGAALQYNAIMEKFNYKVKKLSDGLHDGECTPEYFRKNWTDLGERYIECIDFIGDPMKQGDQLFKKAHAYAVEHNLKWGLIYD